MMAEGRNMRNSHSIIRDIVKKKFFMCVITVSILLFQPYFIQAEAQMETGMPFDKEAFIESAKEKKILRISLVDCITYALKNNLEIKIERIVPKLKEDDVRIAKADFEPAFDADYTLHDSTRESTSTAYPVISKSRDIDFNAGVSGKLITGTEYDIDILNKRYKSNTVSQRLNPYYTSEPKITITQPLFRDFGILINKADIIIAQNNQQESEETFKDMVMGIITETKRTYYNYFYDLKNYSIAELSLKRAMDLLEINRKRYAKGLASSVDLLETEAAALEKEKYILLAESNLRNAEDKLKFITNLIDDPELWNATLEFIDKPEFNIEKINLVDAIENAFNFRPDYKSAKIDLKNRDIKIKVTKNALLPALDLVGSYGLNGLGRHYNKAVDAISEDYEDWNAGVKFSLPWGGEERAKYNQSKSEKVQALLSFKRLEQKIILDIRNKVREVDIQYKQVVAAELSLSKERENYKAQQERYATGYVSVHDMLDYQNKLSLAELDYNKALIEYNIALVNLEKAEGLTLAKNGIKLKV
jgi:outer membrane protein TolC